MSDILLRRPEVEARTGLSRSTIYDWMKRGTFPRPVKLGARVVAWRERDLNEWMSSREPQRHRSDLQTEKNTVARD